MGDYILSIDEGTTGTRVLVVDRAGKAAGKSYSEFTQIFPKPGWVEHDAEEIWAVTLKVIAAALSDAKKKPAEIAAIGITNQRETTVVWDKKTGKPVHNAIVWQCRRTADVCDELKARGLADTVRAKTGLVIDAYFSGTKIKWILDHVSGARTRAHNGELCFGTIDSWLIFKLTGGKSHVTDFTNASRTMIFNIEKKQWDDELLEVLDIPRALLPEPRKSAGDFGTTDCEVLGRGLPVAGVAGDQQAALFGQGCFEPGMIKNTYGTGCFALIFTGGQSLRSQSGLVTTLACGPDGGPGYALEGSIFIAGAAVQWLRDELQIIKDSGETEALARSVPDTAGVYLVPAFVGLGAPYWDPHARGALLGLTRGANRAHVARAALEAIAYQTRDMVDAMKNDLATPQTSRRTPGASDVSRDPQASSLKSQAFGVRELRVDGGACQNNFLMQFQSDLLGLVVDRPVMIETTVMGAAYLAGLAVKLWPDAKSLAALRRTDQKFTPAMPVAEREKLYQGWKEAVERVRSKK